MKFDVSIIIVNYKTPKLVADCIKSVINFTEGISYEVIVVDNNSEQDFKNEIIREVPDASKDNFHFIPLSENIGFGRANNEGLKIAGGRNIFFLNPDTILLNNAIKILSDFLDTHHQAGASGGNLVDDKNIPVLSFKRFLPGLFWEINEILHTLPQKLLYGKNLDYNFTEKPLEVGFISGADLMVKKDILDKTGAFHPDFFMYFEETDLCNRIRKAGYRIYSVPQARIIHLVSQTMTDDKKIQSEFKTSQLEISRNIYYKLNASPLKRILADAIYNLFLNSRIILIKNPDKKDYYKNRKKYFKAWQTQKP